MMNYRHGDLAYLSISGVPFRDFKERNVYYVDKTMLIGIVFGLLPSVKAANLNPPRFRL